MKKLLFLTMLLFAFGMTVQAQEKVYNFNDGSWGQPATERPESGTYTSSTVNGVKLTSAQLYQKDGKGAIRVILDKKSTKSSLEFPEFSDKKSVIIEASVGTEGKTVVVEEKIGKKWTAIGEPIELTKQKAAYSFTLSADATQIRISNPSSSALYIYKVSIK